jgi:hypothetical protein
MSLSLQNNLRYSESVAEAELGASLTDGDLRASSDLSYDDVLLYARESEVRICMNIYMYSNSHRE